MRVIASKARAATIIERVAEKHKIAVSTLLCARWDRFVLIARAEAAGALKDELNWSLRMIGDYIGCTHPNVSKLLSLREKWARRAPVLAPVVDAEGRIRELEAEIARLSGTLLCERLAKALGLRMRCAIVLAILAEAYPRYVRGPALLQLYDEACERLGYGRQGGATHNLMTKNVATLDAELAIVGFRVASSEVGDLPRSRRLTDDAAVWLHKKVGSPKLSQIEAWRESLPAPRLQA